MPVVEVKAVGKLSKEQKSEIARQFSDVLFKVAGKSPDATYITFDEYDKDNFAWKGKLFSDL
jgi:4-oxalocrotonate tautomerase